MTQVIRTATIPDALDGQRFDQAAADLFDEFSRARLQLWIRNGELLADGRKLRPRDPVHPGMELRLAVDLASESARESDWAAEAMPLDIVHEDNAVIVLNKPVGLVVHPAAGNYSGTLVNGLLHHHSALATIPRAGIVHRLDKDTSGLLVVAKTLGAHQSLVQQLQRRSVSREYFAVVRGRPQAAGTINAAMARHPVQRQKMAVARGENGKPAVTHFERVEVFSDAAALKVKLETGRTHQIRVHMLHLKHPLLGDSVYGGKQMPKALALVVKENIERQALHARRLEFLHPESGDSVHFSSALPADIERLLAALRVLSLPK